MRRDADRRSSWSAGGDARTARRAQGLCLVGALCLCSAAPGLEDERESAAPSVRIDQITKGPSHHFFGYIGHVRTIPWNLSERYILALRTTFQDRMPLADDAADIVLLDAGRNYEARVVDRTRAWNPQQGTMFYWNPRAAESQFLFNDRDPETGKVFCVLYDIEKRARVREYRYDDTPVGNGGVEQRGSRFAAINYGRNARLRPVTGYPEAHDWTAGRAHPEDDGVFVVDIETGEKRLIASFRQIRDALRETRPDVQGIPLFINHTLWSRDGERIFFFARGNFSNPATRLDVPFIVRPDGSGLTPLRDHFGGHPEWDEGTRMIGRLGDFQALYDVERQEFAGTIGTPSLLPKPEGDIALSPDRGWLVNGFSESGRNHYSFYRRSDGAHVRSTGIDKGPWTGDLRLDPAPCWNRTGTEVVVPGIAADGTRQMFLLTLTPPKEPSRESSREHVIFEDAFDGRLAAGWSWLREDRSDWRVGDGRLEILVRPGVADNVRNALVRAAPDRSEGAYAVEVTVTNTTPPTQQYEQLGITWYSDGRPVFKLVKELVDGKVLIVPGFKPVASSTVQLRLVVTAGGFTAQYRPDGKGEFQTAATGPLPAPKGDQVSIQCYNGPPDSEHWMRFQSFRILRLEE